MKIIHHPTNPDQRGDQLGPQRAPGAGNIVGVMTTRSGPRIIRKEGAVTPLINFVKGQLPGYVASRYQGTRFGNRSPVPVGMGGVSVLGEGVGVSPVVSGSEGPQKTKVPPAIDRRDTTQVTENVFMQVVNDWFTYHELKAKGVPVKHAPSGTTANIQTGTSTSPIPVHTGGIVSPTKPTIKTGGSMDLGSILKDVVVPLGSQYITTKYAPQPTVQPAFSSVPEIAGDIYDYFVDPATQTMVPVAKKKPCRRRRRRRLATKSDLGDLAALKAILGNGEAFKAWIATHSR